MWGFLKEILEQAGFVAALFTLVLLAAGGAVVVLYRRNQKLNEQLEEAAKDAAKKAEEKDRAHADELKAVADEHARQLTKLSKRIDELQERRVREAGDLTERVMTHIKHIDQFAAKIDATIDVILKANHANHR